MHSHVNIKFGKPMWWDRNSEIEMLIHRKADTEMWCTYSVVLILLVLQSDDVLIVPRFPLNIYTYMQWIKFGYSDVR